MTILIICSLMQDQEQAFYRHAVLAKCHDVLSSVKMQKIEKSLWTVTKKWTKNLEEKTKLEIFQYFSDVRFVSKLYLYRGLTSCKQLEKNIEESPKNLRTNRLTDKRNCYRNRRGNVASKISQLYIILSVAWRHILMFSTTLSSLKRVFEPLWSIRQ